MGERWLWEPPEQGKPVLVQADIWRAGHLCLWFRRVKFRVRWYYTLIGPPPPLAKENRAPKWLVLRTKGDPSGTADHVRPSKGTAGTY